MTRWLALIFILAACASSAPQTPSAKTTLTTPNMPTTSPSSTVDFLLSQMTLEQKIGQTLVIGFKGGVVSQELREMIEEYHVGNIILFEIHKNVESPAAVSQLTHDLQGIALSADMPGLIVSIDQEGGRVTRLMNSKGFTEFPSAMALGATDDPQNAYRVARAIAKEMRALGINANFAPVLDVNNNPANPIIGTRSFGSNPNRVAEFGVEFLDGLQAEGVMAFGKHFPGHGDTGIDSHIALPTVPHPLERLNAVEFVPFRAAIKNHVAGIMSAHAFFPAVDPTPQLAATLSRKALTDLLRGEMGYDGLLITDSLEMGALATSGYPTPKAALAALNAGADLLLFNTGFEEHKKTIALIRESIQRGETPMSRLDEAVRRILIAKQKFGLLNPPVQEPAQVAGKRTQTEDVMTAAREVAAKSITLLRDQQNALPIAPSEKVYVIETPALANFGKRIGASSINVDAEPTGAQIVAAADVARSDPSRVFIVGLTGARTGSAQEKLANALLSSGAKVILVALRDPYDLLLFKTAPAMIATYGNTRPSLDALADVLLGKTKPQGKLPVDLPGMFALGDGLGD